MDLDVSQNQKVKKSLLEKRPVDSKKTESLMILCCLKPLLDLWKCFSRLKLDYGSSLKMLKIGLEVSQKLKRV